MLGGYQTENAIYVFLRTTTISYNSLTYISILSLILKTLKWFLTFDSSFIHSFCCLIKMIGYIVDE